MTGYWAALGTGLGNVFSWPNILIPVLGTLVAMATSFLPGIGGASLATLLLVATVHWDPVSVLLLFGALTGGATFMGSITAILFNIPGNAPSAATLLDGHPMSRAGLPRTAIAAAATASAVGSVFGVLVLIALMPIIRPFILQFGPFEYVLLGVWGLSTIIAVPSASRLKALAMALLGLLVGLVGTDPTYGQPRWTFGSIALFDGVDMVALLLGFFTVSEIISWRKRLQLEKAAGLENANDSIWTGMLAVFCHWGLTMRSSAIGVLVGIIPGVGGTVASFVAYGQAIQTTPKDQRSRFGSGDIRGIIAPEAAVDSKDGGSLLPTVAFGLPGSEGGLILLTVLTVHGIVPGIPMLTTGLPLTFTLITALLLSNLLTSAVGLALTPYFARLTALRIDRIALPIIVVSFVTIVQLNGLLIDLYVAVAFGLAGYMLKRLAWPQIPFVISFVLGGFIERNLALSVELARVGRLNPLQRPASLTIMVIIALSLAWIVRGGVLPPRRVKPKRADAAVAWLLTGGCAVMAAISLQGQPGYSIFAQAVAWCCLFAMLAVALVQTISLVGHAKQGGERTHTIPESHRVPLMMMLLLPAAVWLAGLPAALSLFTLIWIAAGQKLTLKSATLASCTSVAVAVATWFYLDRIAAIDLPASAMSHLF
ncbi:tripartite tricarboxylate transporter permease [Mesorhizobium sp. M0514]|uniref:tripartite tricarboxylate transporter permease n=1 Tax=Mesorhizobium sp. M0514 TaxID=2956955 RepID=UPI003338EA99